jgi:hypothetical protein
MSNKERFYFTNSRKRHEKNVQQQLRKQEMIRNRYMEYMKRFKAENELDIDGNVIYWKEENLIPIPLSFAYFLENN